MGCAFYYLSPPRRVCAWWEQTSKQADNKPMKRASKQASKQTKTRKQEGNLKRYFSLLSHHLLCPTCHKTTQQNEIV